jgi:hypothetical protein
MKGYEEYLQRCIEPDWSSHYINYATIKQKLSSFRSRRRHFNRLVVGKNKSSSADHDDVPPPGYLALQDYQQLVIGAEELISSTNNHHDAASSSYFQHGNYIHAEEALQRLYMTERREFSTLLEQQISNAAIFYEGTLLPQVRQLIAVCRYEEAAKELLEVVAFATVNIITFRQLLIRYDVSFTTYNYAYDVHEITINNIILYQTHSMNQLFTLLQFYHSQGFYRSFSGMPLNEWHLQRSVLATTHPVHDLFELEGVNELEKEIVLGLQQQQQQQQQQRSNIDDVEKQQQQLSEQEFSIQMRGFVHLLEKTDRSLHRAVSGHLVFRDRIITFWIKIRQYLAFGFQGRGIMMNEPRSMLTLRGRHLKEEVRAIGKWKKTKEFDQFQNKRDDDDGDNNESSFRQNLKEISPENVFPLFLNLLACFFFMMNNYIIGGYYLA